jgi:hypothetical protein
MGQPKVSDLEEYAKKEPEEEEKEEEKTAEEPVAEENQEKGETTPV